MVPLNSAKRQEHSFIELFSSFAFIISPVMYPRNKFAHVAMPKVPEAQQLDADGSVQVKTKITTKRGKIGFVCFNNFIYNNVCETQKAIYLKCSTKDCRVRGKIKRTDSGKIYLKSLHKHSSEKFKLEAMELESQLIHWAKEFTNIDPSSLIERMFGKASHTQVYRYFRGRCYKHFWTPKSKVSKFLKLHAIEKI